MVSSWSDPDGLDMGNVLYASQQGHVKRFTNYPLYINLLLDE